MVFFNYALRKLNAKIVYYGPGLCGKTTNLQWIHDHFEGGQRGKMISLSTEGDRTIFFDLLPLEIGTIRSMEVTLQLYTVPGQVHYNSTRQLVLRGADGVVFVGDSQRTMRQSNIDSLRNLQENLMLQGVDLESFPHVQQFNKRDLKDLITVEELDRELNLHSVPFFEAVATEGVGVQETLEGIVKLVMRSLRERYEPVVAPGTRPAATPPAATGPSPMADAPQPASPPAVAPVEPPSPAPPPAAPVREAPPASAEAADPDAAGGAVAPTPFDVRADQDKVSTGVYSVVRKEEPAEPDTDFTPPSLERPAEEYTGAVKPPPPEPPPAPEAVPGLSDEPTKVREVPGEPMQPPAPRRAAPPPVFEQSVMPPAGSDLPPPVSSTSVPFSDQDTDSNIPLPGTESIDIPTKDEGDFAFGLGPESTPAAEEPVVPRETLAAPEEPASIEEIPAMAQPPLASPAPPVGAGESRPDPFGEASFHDTDVVTETGDLELPPVAPEDLADADFEEDLEAEEEPYAESARPFSPDETDTVVPPPGGSVDDLVASVLGSTVPSFKDAEIPTAEEDVAAEEEQPFTEEQLFTDEPMFPEEPMFTEEPAAASEPVTLGEGDPFVVPEPEGPPGTYVLAPSEPREGIVQVGDNQLHLRLEGTGAIAESGQVRALDIEVPVPGSWVGNRRVTLQLRLTLSPVPEDEDGGPGGAS
jgi:signal recognition particle receptor subunit beta